MSGSRAPMLLQLVGAWLVGMAAPGRRARGGGEEGVEEVRSLVTAVCESNAGLCFYWH